MLLIVSLIEIYSPITLGFEAAALDRDSIGIFIFLLVLTLLVIVAGRTRALVTSTFTRLREREALLSVTQRLTLTGSWRYDPTTQHMTWTDEMFRLFELPVGEAPNLETTLSFFTPESQAKLRAKLREALARELTEHRSYDLELEMMTARGTHRWVRAVGEVVFGRGGDSVTYLQGALKDVTGRKQMEADLKKQRDLTHSVIDGLPFPVFLKDRHQNFIIINTYARKMFEIEQRPAAEVTYRDVFGERADEYVAADKAFWASERDHVSEEDTFEMGGDSYDIVLGRKRLTFGDEVLELVYSFDVSEQVATARALRDSEQRLWSLLNAIPDGIIRFDREGRYTEIVPPQNFLPYRSTTSLLGKMPEEVLPPSIAAEIRKRIELALSTGEVQFYEHPMTVLGEERYREVRIVKADDDEAISIIRDITDRKQMEADFKKQRDLTYSVINGLPFPVFLKDNHQNFIIINTYARKMFAIEQRPAAELTYHDVFGERADEYREADKAFLASGRDHVTKEDMFNLGGRHYDIVLGYERLTFGDETLELVYAFDVSEQVATARALGESEARLWSLLNAIPDEIIRSNREGRTLEVIPPQNFPPLQPAPEMLGKTPEETLPPSIAADLRERLEEALATGETQIYEYPLTVLNEENYREVRIVKVNDDETISIVRDITDRKRAELALRESEARNRALLEAIPDGIVCHDRDGYIVDIAPPKDFAPLRDITLMVGKHIDEVLPADVAREVRRQIDLAFQNDEVNTYEYPVEVGDERRYREGRMVAINNHEVFSIVRDVTDRKQAEIAVAEASRHKSEFLATMSHELRTPLTSILGFSEVLLEGYFGALNDKQKGYLGDILSSGQHLLSLINDVLDLSKIEAGKLELEPESLDAVGVVRDALTIIKERAHKHALSLKTELPDEPVTLLADRRKLKQMLYNYLSNAVKFTPEGGCITLRVEGHPDEVRFEVRDTGIGIAPDDHDKLFRAFSQVDSSLTRRYEGTGLGLSLVKRLAELHGGRVWIRSELGEGSTFGFALPKKVLAQSPQEDRSA